VLDFSDLYTVIGKTSTTPPPSRDVFRQMLQALLADRFQLQIHHLQKEFPTFNLVVSPHGLKLKDSAPDAKMAMNQDARVNRGRSNRITATHISLEQLVTNLGGYSGRPVFDHTGLTGIYDFVLSFDFDPSATDASPDAIGQDFVTALEKQLGLKLEPSTASFDTVVIDRAEKPSGN
jgi:uncharacterized protein (TIGR03435 family)